MNIETNKSLKAFILDCSGEFKNEQEKLLSGIAEDAGFEIKSSDSVDSALEILKEYKCDIMLQCLNNGKTGLDPFIMIKQKYPDVPVIIISDEYHEGIDEKAIAMGVQDFLVMKDADSIRLRKSMQHAILRKNREKEQRDTEEKWRQLVKNASGIILNVAYDGTILFINKSSSWISPKNHLGMSIYYIMPRNHKNKIKNSIENVFRNEKPISLKTTAVGKDKSVRTYNVRMAPIKKQEQVVAVNITITDISRLIRLEKEIHQARTLESIGTLAAGIAHEINTPMQYIQDNTLFFENNIKNLINYHDKIQEILQKGGDNKTGSIIKKINSVSEEFDIEYYRKEIPSAISQSFEGIDRIKKIISAIRFFSHMDSDEPEKADINQVIENSVMISKNEWKYVADIETNLDHSIPEIKCFINGLNQTLMNLIVNAAQAVSDSVDGGKKGKGLISISSAKKNDSIIITVKDTGTGIPDSIKDKIFHPFFTTKKAGKGTGQGLALAYDVIIKKHKGSITVDSKPGKGSAFTITLPAITE